MTNQNPDPEDLTPASEPEPRFEYGQLPPGVHRGPRGLYREIPAHTGRKNPRTGEPLTTIRRKAVTLDRDQAVEKRMDYFDPQFGWLIDGFKLERDRNVEDIWADNSASYVNKPMEV